MAKSSGKTLGTSRIKFIMFDAEIADDQIQSVTQAITNALRGPVGAPTIKRIAAPLNGDAEHQEVDGEAEEVFEEEITEAAPARARSSAPRKPAPTPEILPIDFNSYDVPLGTFTAEYKTESHQTRYLVSAAWFHEHGGVAKVTPAHIYSAYRWLKWPLTLKDFAQPLRDLKVQQLFTSTEKGTYTLHHVGLQRVAELKTGNGG
jgi:hypothetical protein